MNTYYYVNNSEGNHLFDNFPPSLLYLTQNYKQSSTPIQIKIDGVDKLARLAKKQTVNGSIFVLSLEEKYVRRKKLFKELVEMSTISIKSISFLQKSVIHQQTSRAEEFIHNITSLNSYCIQDLFALIPQQILSENINKQTETIRDIISGQANVAAATILKLIKYCVAMKVEFSVFERIQKTSMTLQKTKYPIRSLILSILQIFIDDFEKKTIEVSVDAGQSSERLIEIDHDSLFVSLFYLFENSVKYCCPNTKYKIIFTEEDSCFSIILKMVSIKILDSEIDSLTENGYRSKSAESLNSEGKGIGMYRVVHTLQLNNARLEISPRCNDYKRKVNGVEYEGNQFKIKFIGQQNWFN